MHPSDASKDSEIIAKKCLALLGDRKALHDLDDLLDVEALAVVDEGIGSSSEFRGYVKTHRLQQVKGQNGHSYPIEALRENAKESLQRYLKTGTPTKDLRTRLDRTIQGYHDIAAKLEHKKKKVDKYLDGDITPQRKKFLAESRLLATAIEHAIIVSSQLESMVECIYHVRARKDFNENNHPRAADQTANEEQAPGLSPTHVSERGQIACEKCLAALGDEDAMHKLRQYKQPKLQPLIDETKQTRPKLLKWIRSRHAKKFDMAAANTAAHDIIFGWLQKDFVAREEKLELAKIRNMYDDIGVLLASDKKFPMPTQRDALIQYTATVSSQISAVLQFMEKKEKDDPCNRLLAALGDEDALHLLKKDATGTMRQLAKTIRSDMENFYEVLDKEKLAVIAMRGRDGRMDTFDFKQEAGLTCMALRHIRDVTSAPKREIFLQLERAGHALSTFQMLLEEKYPNIQERPDNIQAAVEYADTMIYDLSDLMRHVSARKTDIIRGQGALLSPTRGL